MTKKTGGWRSWVNSSQTQVNFSQSQLQQSTQSLLKYLVAGNTGMCSYLIISVHSACCHVFGTGTLMNFGNFDSGCIFLLIIFSEGNCSRSRLVLKNIKFRSINIFLSIMSSDYIDGFLCQFPFCLLWTSVSQLRN